MNGMSPVAAGVEAAVAPPPDMPGTTLAPGIAAGGPPPNFDTIVPALLSGDVIPFLGAGASIFHRPPGDSQCPPSAQGLARRLADTARFPNDAADAQQFREDLARVASYFAYVEDDREGLRRCLREVFKFSFQPNQLHKTLAKVAKQRPILIITTNYDDMIEQAFDDQKVKYHLVVTAVEEQTIKHKQPGSTLDDTDPQKINLSLDSDYSIIFKMHGSVDRAQNNYRKDYYVITEEDYVYFLGTMLDMIPGTINVLYMRRKFLFLGYSLRDWNFRVMLSGALQSTLKSWAIQRNPNLIDSKLWEKKNVTIYDMDLRTFSEELERCVDNRLQAS